MVDRRQQRLVTSEHHEEHGAADTRNHQGGSTKDSSEEQKQQGRMKTSLAGSDFRSRSIPDCQTADDQKSQQKSQNMGSGNPGRRNLFPDRGNSAQDQPKKGKRGGPG